MSTEDGATASVVLAAGRGTRMHSPEPKVVRLLNGRPMISYVMESLRRAGFGSRLGPDPVVVVGFGQESVREAVGSQAQFVVQHQQQGTGHAAKIGIQAIDPRFNRILLVHGDEPLIEADVFTEMLNRSIRTKAAIVLLTGVVTNTHGMGRVIRDASGSILGLVQESELDAGQRRAMEINLGAYVFDRLFLENAIRALTLHDGGEYYLTDLVELAVNKGLCIESIQLPDADERIGVNDLQQLQRATEFLKRRDS